jgi:hypothetical protein
VRAAIAAALGDFKGDEGAFSMETKLVIYGGIGAGMSHAFDSKCVTRSCDAAQRGCLEDAAES